MLNADWRQTRSLAKSYGFRVRPRALAERAMPHRGAGDAWRGHHVVMGLGELWREVKGLESLGVGIRHDRLSAK